MNVTTLQSIYSIAWIPLVVVFIRTLHNTELWAAGYAGSQGPIHWMLGRNLAIKYN